jgi:Asp-tRNA(Asn)/Glu-tRNA(Gln) amidotransferase A subunit family amidase
MTEGYHPAGATYLSFATARKRFADGTDSPRAFLERCLEAIERREREIKAFVILDPEAARVAADAASERWRQRKAQSGIDGMPVGIKDCFDVCDWRTQANSALFTERIADTDAAHVDALRRSGAIVLGKTTTTELAMATAPHTRNPWDLRRTPGGSSSGSAAAVAAGMLPVATGSQVRGSVIRPASICGVVGFKPTFGALNRHGGIDPSPSLNHLGVLGGTLTDVWETAYHIAVHAGGDPGFPALCGPSQLPPARRPLRLARQYTFGWPKTDEESQSAFDSVLRSCRARGVEIVEPEAAEPLRFYEEATVRAPEFIMDLMTFELRWPLGLWNRQRPGLVSRTVDQLLKRAETMSLQQYRVACERREQLRALHRQLAGRVDAFITLSHIGPGPFGHRSTGMRFRETRRGSGGYRTLAAANPHSAARLNLNRVRSPLARVRAGTPGSRHGRSPARQRDSRGALDC